MHGSRQATGISDSDSAAQHNRAPRPLPLFLELVRAISEREPELAGSALRGLAKYQQAERPKTRRERPVLARVRGASLRDCGGHGAPALLVPSLINPPEILDLDEDVSLANAVAATERHALLFDWGAASERSELDIAGHVSELLAPLVRELEEPPALIGYCLGGTMAIAAANLVRAERVVTIAAPWRFSAYPESSRESLLRLWNGARPAAERLGALPMEVLQAAFWSLDPERTVAKFAAFADVGANSAKAQRFVTLEDWANEGEPLPCPAARELIEDLFGNRLPECHQWQIGGKTITDQIECPLLNITAAQDRIIPAAAAPRRGQSAAIAAGHVGMIVGSKRTSLHEKLREFFSSSSRP
jgi:polyhydroxyalkanoate synthase